MDIVIQKRRYSSNDVEIAIAGNVMTGVTRIDYKESQEVAPVDVIGNAEAAGYTVGKRRYSANVNILWDDYMAMQNALADTVLKMKPFSITVAYLQPGFYRKETLIGCIPTESARQVEGSSNNALEAQLSLFVIKVETSK